MAYESGLTVSAFSIGAQNLLALLKTFEIGIKNDMADPSGISARHELAIAVKQDQKFDFTVMQNNVNGVPNSNLDVSLWDVGGVHYVGQLRGGSINVETITKERSSIASAYKIPGGQRTHVDVTSDFLVINAANLTNTLITGTAAQFNVLVAITFGTVVFTAPMILEGTTLKGDRGEFQMENVRLALQAPPTGPNDATLLGNILLGSALVTLSIDTGGNTYSTATGIITKLTTPFADAQIIDQQGTIQVQGAFGVGGP